MTKERDALLVENEVLWQLYDYVIQCNRQGINWPQETFGHFISLLSRLKSLKDIKNEIELRTELRRTPPSTQSK